jgi:drug/metabolite transporter (DMT)-like permease
VRRAPAVWAALGIVYVVWGSTYLGIQVAGETIPAFVAVTGRFLIAGAVLAAIVAVRRGGEALRIDRRQAAALALVGLLLPGSNALLFLAERTVPTGLAALIFCTVPLVVTGLRIATGERPPRVVLVGIATGFVGVAVLLHPEGSATVGGLALVVVAAIGWGVGSFLVPRLPMPAEPFAATAWQALFGGVVMLPFAVLQGFDPSAVTTRSWVGFAYLVLFGSLIGFTAYSWLLGHAPIGLVATYAFVNPVVAIILGIVVLSEGLSTRTVVGAAITLASVALVVRREAADAAPAGVEARP